MPFASEFSIGKFVIGRGRLPFVIAEAGVNHNGNLSLAKRLVDAAVKVGAHAVKFQTFKGEDLATESAEMAAYQKANLGKVTSQRDMLKSLELPDEAYRELADYCKSKGIIFMSTPHTVPAADILEPLVPAWKIGSADLTNIPLLEQVARTGKPIIISTGMATVEETKLALAHLEKSGAREVVVLHCTSNYPCPLDQVNLRAMLTLERECNCLVGYSDHTPGVLVPALATSMGAVVIEKHFTVDKSLPGPDQKASLDPEEFAELMQVVKDAHVAAGSAEKRPGAAERVIAAQVRKSLVTARDLPAGHTITASDLTVKRPASGIPPTDLGKVIGRSTKNAIKRDQVLQEAMLL